MSSTDKGEGLVTQGRPDGAPGDLPDGQRVEVGGAARPLAGKPQSLVGKLKDQAPGMSQTISSAAGKAKDQAKGLYAQVVGRHDIAAARLDPFVRERPYTAISIAAATGLLAGLVWARGGSKVVYLKQRL